MKNTDKKSFRNRIAILNTMVRDLVAMKSSISINIPKTDIDATIQHLKKSIDDLHQEFARVDFMAQFEDAPWVITQRDSNPWYYQLVSVNGTTSTLSRQGRTKSVSYREFQRDYVVATESQVLQHIEFLTRVGKPFIKKVIPCDTTPILDCSGLDEVIPIASKKQTLSVKPKDADFYCVTLKQGRGCTVYHGDYDTAEKEAIRLSKQESKKAYVLGVVGVIDVVPTTTYETKIEKY